MSRQIDLTKPLSDEDREYLDTRSRQDLIALNDEQFGDSDEAEDEYSDMTNEALRAELGERELSQSGTKAELIARLREDDAAE